MSGERIAEAFARAAQANRAALVGYLTAYDPNLEASISRVHTAVAAGVDIVELGVPFSDPTADGPVVQNAMLRARRAGATVAGVLAMAQRLRREDLRAPIVLFSYANPLLPLGPTLGPRLRDAGIDGVLVVDLPAEHAAELRDPIVAEGLEWVGLVAPTTPAHRLPAVVGGATGFVYAVTLKGVTGASVDVGRHELVAQLKAIRSHAKCPIAAGFGVRHPAQAAALAQSADGVVVGSALIEAAGQGKQALADYVRSLRAALGKENTPRS